MLVTHTVLSEDSDKETLNEDTDADNEIKRKITYCSVLSNGKVIMASMTVIVSV